MLDNFEITSFRKFRHLRLDRLGLINLIVGKNNTGKTALLDAIQLYSEGVDRYSIYNLLSRHDEYSSSEKEDALAAIGGFDIASIFHDRTFVIGDGKGVRIGRVGHDDLAVAIDGVIVDAEIYENNPENLERARLVGNHVDQDRRYELVFITSQGKRRHYFSKKREDTLSIRDMARRRRRGTVSAGPYNFINVPSNTGSQSDLALQWDNIVLKGAEDRIIDVLKTIVPVNRVTFISHPTYNNERIVIFKMDNLTNPVPLKSMGEGTHRIFQIALALESARAEKLNFVDPLFEELLDSKRGTLLAIDEIENGIHYSVLNKLWHFIFDLAIEQGIQVFATTHSWDCIQAFQNVAVERQDADGVLIKLEEREGDIKAEIFSEDELTIITRNSIEVR